MGFEKGGAASGRYSGLGGIAVEPFDDLAATTAGEAQECEKSDQ